MAVSVVLCFGATVDRAALSSTWVRFSWAGWVGLCAEVPVAPELALRQVERAVGETLEHHAHVRLRPAA